MTTTPRLWAASAIVFCGTLSNSHAGTIYDESSSGDLSNSGLTPSVLSVSVGSNQIFGTTGRVTSGIDRDYFTIFIPTGLQLTQLIELPPTTVGGAVSFLGIQAGPQVTLPTSAATADGLLGWTHYATVADPTDLLPTIGIPAQGSAGFPGSLRSGTYAFWIQDFGTGTFAYAFDLELAPTPEPATYAFVLVGGVVFAIRRRRLRPE